MDENQEISGCEVPSLTSCNLSEAGNKFFCLDLLFTHSFRWFQVPLAPKYFFTKMNVCTHFFILLTNCAIL